MNWHLYIFLLPLLDMITYCTLVYIFRFRQRNVQWTLDLFDFVSSITIGIAIGNAAVLNAPIPDSHLIITVIADIYRSLQCVRLFHGFLSVTLFYLYDITQGITLRDLWYTIGYFCIGIITFVIIAVLRAIQSIEPYSTYRILIKNSVLKIKIIIWTSPLLLWVVAHTSATILRLEGLVYLDFATHLLVNYMLLSRLWLMKLPDTISSLEEAPTRRHNYESNITPVLVQDSHEAMVPLDKYSDDQVLLKQKTEDSYHTRSCV
ncbi:hypothetical protein BDD12DRAFT_459589 [Trichophaea hybrida]|nr:hypothetical protein BDD12DRAFT_459589 [Trichophaea hybrida]